MTPGGVRGIARSAGRHGGRGIGERPGGDNGKAPAHG